MNILKSLKYYLTYPPVKGITQLLAKAYLFVNRGWFEVKMNRLPEIYINHETTFPRGIFYSVYKNK